MNLLDKLLVIKENFANAILSLIFNIIIYSNLKKCPNIIKYNKLLNVFLKILNYITIQMLQ